MSRTRVLLMLVIGALALLPAPASAQASEELEAGIRAYVDGDPRQAIRRIGDALDAGAIPPALRGRAYVYMANSFLALGDTLSAIPHIRGAFEVEPCALPPPDRTPPGAIGLYERYRPAGVSCEPRMGTAVVRSLVLPGWGQRSLDRRGANYFLGGTVGAALGSVVFGARASSRYDDYQTTTDSLAVSRLYDDAESARRNSVVLGMFAAGLYVWNVLDAALGGATYDRRLSRVRPMSVRPVVTPTDTGARVALEVLLP